MPVKLVSFLINATSGIESLLYCMEMKTSKLYRNTGNCDFYPWQEAILLYVNSNSPHFSNLTDPTTQICNPAYRVNEKINR